MEEYIELLDYSDIDYDRDIFFNLVR